MRHNQQGASYIAILLGIMGFCFLAKILVTVWAPYMDDHMLNKQIIAQLKDGQKGLTPGKFSQEMDKRLSMNNLHDMKFADVATVIDVDGIQVKKSYEIRENLLMNIDLILKFEKDFDQRSAQAQ